MFIEQLFNGIMLGSIYCLISTGYSLVFGTLRMLNMAYGETFMAGSIVLGLLLNISVGFATGILVGSIIGGLIGLLIYYLCFVATKSKGEFAVPAALSTIGMGMVLVNLTVNYVGSEPFSIDTPGGVLGSIGAIMVSDLQALILALALGTVFLISYLIARTNFGRSLRAVSEKPEMAACLGVNISTIVVLTFLLSGIMAGLAGGLTSLRIGSVSPFIGTVFGMKALAVMIIGGLGSYWGVASAGLLLGLIEVLTSAYLSASYGEGVIWALLILVLLFRPEGLFASHSGERF